MTEIVGDLIVNDQSVNPQKSYYISGSLKLLILLLSESLFISHLMLDNDSRKLRFNEPERQLFFVVVVVLLLAVDDACKVIF